MTLMVGHNCGTPCDPCDPCDCGPFCSNTPYCGCDMSWVVTLSGASDITGTCTCSELNVASSVTGPATTVSAAAWNASRPAWTGRDAKSGTNVSTWTISSATTSTCTSGFSNLSDGTLTVYLGDNDKWYMVVSVFLSDSDGTSSCGIDVAGESEFSGSGSPMDCGTVGEGTPTFSLSVSLSNYFGFPCSPITCNPPTAALVEGNPQ